MFLLTHRDYTVMVTHQDTHTDNNHSILHEDGHFEDGNTHFSIFLNIQP